jgi:hypothetical protein
MKHQWKTDDQGNVQPIDRDADHPITECVLCGTTSGCLDAGDFCAAIGADPRLDADDCEGLDLTVDVHISIRHPGKATCYDDRFFVGQSVRIPLASLLDAYTDLAEHHLADLVKAMTEQWRVAKSAHQQDWERAVDAAERRADTEGERP